jgi:hypothetical protein
MKTLNPVSTIPSDLKPTDRLGYKIIAVIGYGNDWCAYLGLSDWDDERVTMEGDKLDQKIAERLFYAPVAAGLIYRD